MHEEALSKFSIDIFVGNDLNARSNLVGFHSVVACFFAGELVG